MPFRNVSLFSELVRSPEMGPTLSVEFTRELEDLRNFLLNLLMMFLTVHVISASSALGVTTLALLVYTINLHIAINTRFLREYPTLSRFLHAVPLLGIFCMVVFKLVIVVQSPAVAAAVLFACALPSFIIAVHLAAQYAQMMPIPFPVQMWDVAPSVPGPAHTAVVPG